MNIDIERLKHDREYWDECDPSSGEATHYDGGSSMDYPSFMKLENGKCAFWNADTNSWKYYHGQGSHLYIPRPAKQWSGDGLPPVGVECEFTPSRDHYDLYPVSDWVHGDKIEVVAHKANGRDVLPVVYNMRHQSASILIPECIRPLKSEKDRVVEAAMEYAPWPGDSTTENTLKALYEVGFLKMPEGES